MRSERTIDHKHKASIKINGHDIEIVIKRKGKWLVFTTWTEVDYRYITVEAVEAIPHKAKKFPIYPHSYPMILHTNTLSRSYGHEFWPYNVFDLDAYIEGIRGEHEKAYKDDITVKTAISRIAALTPPLPPPDRAITLYGRVAPPPLPPPKRHKKQ